MNAKTQIKNPWSGKLSSVVCITVLLLALSAGCGPANTQPPGQPAANATEPPVPQTTPVFTDNSEAPTRPLSTATAALATPFPTPTNEAMIPAGWATHTSQQCEYAIGYPPEMQINSEGTYSRTLWFQQADPAQGARNFVYVSVIDPEVQSMVEEGVYNFDIYNFNPAEAQTLLNIQVGESIVVNPVPDMAQWFTYQRVPDTSISGHAAQTYENVQPWEFPDGTKEIRYYLSLNRCTYLIGGYLDTTGSNQSGAITEELFDQIVATFRLIP